MTNHDLQERTKQFALRVIGLVAALPATRVGDVLGRQLLKSGTSIGANYREAQHASSRKQFVSYVEIAHREADETLYWLDLVAGSEIVKPARLQECEELTAMLSTVGRRAKLPKPT